MLNDLDIYNSKYKKKILKEINKTFKGNNFIFGPSVKKFEKNLKLYTGSKYAITVKSGTDALFLSLKSLNLKKGDQVIIPSFSWISVLEVVLLLNLKPIFADTDINNFNMDLNKIEKLISKKTKVIISTSLFGRSIDLNFLKKLCLKNKIILIEDAAQNFGSYIGKKNSCNVANISCTSFFPSKNLGCLGDGGAVFTNDKQIGENIIKLRNHGQVKYNDARLVGINSRLGSIQSAILLEKLKDLKNKKKRHQKIYKKYQNFFEKKKIIGFPLQRTNKNEYNDMYSQFSILLNKREKFIKYCKKYNIHYKIYYSKPLYKQFLLNYKKKLTVTESICKKIISLPFNDISNQRFNIVIKKLKKIINIDKDIFFEA